jgi:hypothetical protein
MFFSKNKFSEEDIFGNLRNAFFTVQCRNVFTFAETFFFLKTKSFHFFSPCSFLFPILKIFHWDVEFPTIDCHRAPRFPFIFHEEGEMHFIQ